MPDTNNKTPENALEKNVSTRFETPILDSLREMQRNFVLAYCSCFDVAMAAKTAGYHNEIPSARRNQEKSLIENPLIVAAIDEYSAQREVQLEAAKIAMCTQMYATATCSIYDICDRVPYKNGHGTAVEGKWMFIPKELADIEPQFVSAASLMVKRADGSYGFDNASQLKNRMLLSKLMKWDQGTLDQGTPIIFNFGNIQEKEYVKPERKASQVDMSTFEKDDDIDDLAK